MKLNHGRLSPDNAVLLRVISRLLRTFLFLRLRLLRLRPQDHPLTFGTCEEAPLQTFFAVVTRLVGLDAGASGIQHIGQRDIAWIRVSQSAADKGFDLEHFGKILHARMHSDFGAIVDKVQVTVYTEEAKFRIKESGSCAFNQRG